MLKTLIRKQFMELFRSYFVNAKNGKARSKGGTVTLFSLFALLMLFLCGIFFAVAFLLGDSLIGIGAGWLYFSLMAMISILFGTFGSVFNTFTALYSAKDNDFLLSMPIPPATILLSRIILVYGMSLLYSGSVWIPTVVCRLIIGKTPVLSIIFSILLIFIISLFVTVLTCLLGWLVALIAKRLKNKGILTAIIAVAFLGLYYLVCFNMNDLLQSLISNSEKIGNSLKTWANFIYQLGQAADGKIGAMLIFCGVTAVLAVLCFWILSKSFIHIATADNGTKKSEYKGVAEKAHGSKSALFRRELKRFTASPTYMLNSGLGILFLLIIPVIVLIKRDTVNGLLTVLQMMLPEAEAIVPIGILAITCMITGMNVISTPSVSLEGKNLWIIRTMPVPSIDILNAKRKLHVWLNIIPALICNIACCLILKQDLTMTVLNIAFIWIYVQFTAQFGLMLGILRPNLTWTNETTPIKQSTNVLIAMLAGWIIPILVGGGYYLLRDKLEGYQFLCVCIILLALVVRWLDQWMRTKGVRAFEQL